MDSFKTILDSRAYIINLDVAHERLEKCMRNLSRAGFTQIERVSGIYASIMSSKALEDAWAFHGSPSIKKTVLKNILLDFHIGRHGVMLSHLNIWKKIIESSGDDAECFTIFEDDIIFHSDWENLAEVYYSKTPSDFDVVFMGNQIQVIGEDRKLIPAKCPESEICSIPSFCLHAYIITRRGAKKLYEAILNYEGGVYTIDLMLFDLMRKLHYTSCPFTWYCWNVANLYPCKEQIKNKKAISIYYKLRNNGMVFQNHLDESFIC